MFFFLVSAVCRLMKFKLQQAEYSPRPLLQKHNAPQDLAILVRSPPSNSAPWMLHYILWFCINGLSHLLHSFTICHITCRRHTKLSCVTPSNIQDYFSVKHLVQLFVLPGLPARSSLQVWTTKPPMIILLREQMVCECAFSPDNSDPHNCTNAVHKEIWLTVAPSRSSPEAKTCRGPRRCEWSEPALALESGKIKEIIK